MKQAEKEYEFQQYMGRGIDDDAIVRWCTVPKEVVEQIKRDVIPEGHSVYRDKDVQLLIDALEKLARLGNGESYGDSDGNIIAIDALYEFRKEEG